MSKKLVTRELDVDTNRLFGDSLGDTVAYLNEVKAQHPDKLLSLEEKWHGYEDNYFVFSYEELETDQEVADRMELKRREAEEARRREDEERSRREDERQFEILRRRLGKR